MLVGVASARTLGCTVTAVNIAAALGRAGHDVVLVDLDPRGGRVANWLRMSDRGGLAMAAERHGRTPTCDELRVELRAAPALRGVRVLTGVTVGQRDMLDVPAVARCAAAFGEVVIADLGPLPGPALGTAAECDELLLLVRPDLIGVAPAREAVSVGVPGRRVCVAVAPLGSHPRSATADLERLVREPVVGTIPFVPREAARALRTGGALGGPAAREFDRLGRALVAGALETSETAGPGEAVVALGHEVPQETPHAR